MIKIKIKARNIDFRLDLFLTSTSDMVAPRPHPYVLTTALLLLAATCGTVQGASTIPEITCSEPVGDGGDDASFRFSTLQNCEEGLGAISTYASAALANETAGDASAIDALSCQPSPYEGGGYSLFGCSNDGNDEGDAQTKNVLATLSTYVRSVLPWNDALGDPLPMVACATGGYVAFPAASLQSRCAGDIHSLFPWADINNATASIICAEIFECTYVATSLTRLVTSTRSCNGNGDYVEGEGGSEACICFSAWVGPACEYSDATTCAGNGAVDELTGECSCSEPFLGVGCEYSNATTCSGNGAVDDLTGECNCTASFLGVGCAYSDATTCSGRGLVDDQGRCECAGPPGHVFYGNYTGEDCAGAAQLMSLEDEENARYTTYYILFGIMATLGISIRLFG